MQHQHQQITPNTMPLMSLTRFRPSRVETQQRLGKTARRMRGFGPQRQVLPCTGRRRCTASGRQPATTGAGGQGFKQSVMTTWKRHVSLTSFMHPAAQVFSMVAEVVFAVTRLENLWQNLVCWSMKVVLLSLPFTPKNLANVSLHLHSSSTA